MATSEKNEHSGGRKVVILLTIFALAGGLWFGYRAYSSVCPDTDNDGLDDCEEQNIYFTDWFNPDTDSDGYPDGQEIANGYSPHRASLRLTEVDSDGDGLTDDLELAFGSSLYNPDTDGDGYTDGFEVHNGYSPVDPSPKKLTKRITIYTSENRLEYFLKDIRIGSLPVQSISAGVPTGTFTITTKHPRAWVNEDGAWLDSWISLKGDRFGIAAETDSDISIDYILLAPEDAAFLYTWADIKVRVRIER